MCTSDPNDAELQVYKIVQEKECLVPLSPTITVGDVSITQATQQLTLYDQNQTTLIKELKKEQEDSRSDKKQKLRILNPPNGWSSRQPPIMVKLYQRLHRITVSTYIKNLQLPKQETCVLNKWWYFRCTLIQYIYHMMPYICTNISVCLFNCPLE